MILGIDTQAQLAAADIAALAHEAGGPEFEPVIREWVYVAQQRQLPDEMEAVFEGSEFMLDHIHVAGITAPQDLVDQSPSSLEAILRQRVGPVDQDKIMLWRTRAQQATAQKPWLKLWTAGPGALHR